MIPSATAETLIGDDASLTKDMPTGNIGVIEAVITAGFSVIDCSSTELRLRMRFGANLLELGR